MVSFVHSFPQNKTVYSECIECIIWIVMGNAYDTRGGKLQGLFFFFFFFGKVDGVVKRELVGLSGDVYDILLYK